MLLAGLTYGFIACVDPHAHLAWSPRAERALVNGNQRFSYPAVARDPRFDSFVLGTSTTRMLEPRHLDTRLGGRFANLSMNSATAYEQSRLHELIVKARAGSRLRTLLIGIDISWCRVAQSVQRYTFRHFPEWLYDESPFNDYLHIFNAETLEQAAKQVQYWRGHLEPKYQSDGYKSFLPDPSEYDLERARTNIYGQPLPKSKPDGRPMSAELNRESATWQYPSHALLKAMLHNTPRATQVILMIVPYHWFHQAVTGTKDGARWHECKRRIAQLASARPGALLLDFMIDSPLTRNDENYWDKLHFGARTAAQIVDEIASAARQNVTATASAKVLVRNDNAR